MSVHTMRKSLFGQGMDCEIVIVDILGVPCGFSARMVEDVVPLPEIIALPPCARVSFHCKMIFYRLPKLFPGTKPVSA